MCRLPRKRWGDQGKGAALTVGLGGTARQQLPVPLGVEHDDGAGATDRLGREDFEEPALPTPRRASDEHMPDHFTPGHHQRLLGLLPDGMQRRAQTDRLAGPKRLTRRRPRASACAGLSGMSATGPSGPGGLSHSETTACGACREGCSWGVPLACELPQQLLHLGDQKSTAPTGAL